MDKFDFDLYKKQTDEIDLTDKQKQDLISNILDKEKRENLKVIDFPTEKPKIYKYKNLLTIAAGFVVIVSIAFLTNLVPGFLSSQKMDEFSLVNSLSDKDKKSIQKEIVVEFKDEKSGKKREVESKPLDLQLKGKHISKVDVYSAGNNYIVLNSYSSGTAYAEASTSYSEIDYNDIDFLGWMPSDENIDNLKALSAQSTADEYYKYMYDTIYMTIYFSNGDTVKQKLVVSYDDNYNYTIE